MKKLHIFLFLLLVAVSIFGQNVEIQGDATISGQVTVMDTILFADGTELASACLQILQDTDSDTKIEVEKNPDEDIIRFTVDGNEVAVFEKNRLTLAHSGNSIFIGTNAGVNDNGNNNNLVVGRGAGTSITSGSNNTLIGQGSGASFATGSNNVYIGTDAGSEEEGSENTFVGKEAGSASSGSGNVFLGYQAGLTLWGDNKLAVDNSATNDPLIYGEFDNNLIRINGKLNINNAYDLPETAGTSGQVLSYDGSGAMQWVNPSATSSFEDADGDTKIQVEETPDDDKIRFHVKGNEIMSLDSSHLHLENPGRSIHIGRDAGIHDDGTNNENVFIGQNAGKWNDSGSSNVFLGGGAGSINIDGSQNTFIGSSSGANMENGSNNTFVGHVSGGESEGSENTFIGKGSGFSSSGIKNTFIGQYAGENNYNGNNNTFIGAGSGLNSTGNSNIFIGNDAGKTSVKSNTLIIDNGDTPIPFIYGEFDNHKLELDAWTRVLRRLDIDNNKLQFTNLGTGDGNKGIQFGDQSYGILGLVYEKGAGAYDHKLHFKSYFDQLGDKLMTFDGASGKIGIGSADPETSLHVKASNNNGHVMKIENTNSSSTADGLEIKINRAVAGLENNYITFNDANSVAGRIEGFAVGEGPNFTDFPGVNLDLYFDVASIIANSFDKGSFPYYDLNTLVLPPFDPGSLGEIEGSFSMYPQNFVDNVICLGNPFCGAADMKTVGYIDVSNPTAQPPGLDWNQFMWPDLVPGSPPSLDLSVLLNPVVLTSAYADMTAIANWAFENGVEALSADPFHIALMQDPDYWSNMASWKHGGVTYGSKGADYAEWLEREDPTKDIKAGQIVGVKNGKISLNTKDADQIMAISVMPVVLGNMPDSSRQEDFEKVAFIGQTPVWVVGEVKSGDYIIASGNNDGFGIPVSQDDITIEQVSKVVGRAWEDGEQMINLVNMAVGLKTNEMATILARTSEKVNALEARLGQIEVALGIPEIAKN